MTFSDVVGVIGVGLLLLAFILNILQVLNQNSWLYIIMNITGATIACYASVLINYFPFVILEGSWCFIALVGAIKKVFKG